MQPPLVAGIVFATLFFAVWVGRILRGLVPEHHLSADTKDSFKLAVGMVATMSALLLGLLVSSSKGSYDSIRNEVIGMAANVALLDRVLELYGPEASSVRDQFHATVEEVIQQIWPQEAGASARLTLKTSSGGALFGAIQALSPHDDTQRSLKSEATTLSIEIARLRSLLQAQAVSSISKPLLVTLVCWLIVIFLGFSVFAPRNATATLALLISAFSVAGAVFLILEFDHPFEGLIRISSEPMRNAVMQFNEAGSH